ncbi:MAG: exodeoxyribonuclease VII small subunit [Gemmatimonadota bacterium]
MNSPGNPSLSQALTRLEEIVRRLEAEETELDQALALFEEGVGVLRVARGQLEAAELKVQQVLEGASGELTIRDLDG